MIFTGLGTGFFNTANQAALVGSVPREYRGFATGMVQTVFGVGSLLGISLAGLLMTSAFRHYTGTAGLAPTPDEPAPSSPRSTRRAWRAPPWWRWLSLPRSRAAAHGSRQRRAWAEGRDGDRERGPLFSCTIHLYRRTQRMKTVSVAQARSRLKALLDEVSSGHKVSVVRRGREVAQLVPPRSRKRRLPALGWFRASIRVTGEPVSRTVVRARRNARY